MSPITTALALGAALVLTTGLSAHAAGGGAPSRDADDAPWSLPFFATSLVQRPGLPGLALPRASDGYTTREEERGESQREQLEPAFFEPEPAPQLAGFGVLEGGRDPLGRLTRRARRKPGFTLDLPKGAHFTASAGSLQPRATWVQGPVLRSETSVVLPLGDRFAVQTTLVDLYHASPAEGADSNVFQTLVGVSLQF
jgi:hypothetical protein